jgi:hypothetical protein
VVGSHGMCEALQRAEALYNLALPASRKQRQWAA